MAEKLRVEIALEGGKEVAKQLDAIGQAGTDAFAEITKAAENVGGDKVGAKLQALGQQFAALAQAGAQAFAEISQAAQGAVGSELSERLQVLGEQFAALGQAGTKAFADIAASAKEAKGAGEGIKATTDEASLGFEHLAVAAAAGAKGILEVGKAALGFVKSPLVAATIAVVGALTSVVVITQQVAQSINELNAQAKALGLPVAQLDQYRLALERAGLSQGAISDGFAHWQSTIDKLNVEKVKEIGDSLKQGAFFDIGDEAIAGLKKLRELAIQAGEAGKAARKVLEEIGLPIDTGVEKSFQQLIKDGVSVDEAISRTIKKFAEMKDSAGRSAMAIDELGNKFGPELIAKLQAGGGGLERFKQGVIAATAEQTKAAAEQARMAEEVRNATTRMGNAWNSLIATIERVGTLDFAPGIIQGINIITQVLGGLNMMLENPSWEKFSAAADATFQQILGGLPMVRDAILALVTAGAEGAWKWILDAFNFVIAELKASGEQMMADVWKWVTTAPANAWRWIVDTFKAVIAQITGGGGAAPAGGGIGSMARGGRVGGRGTGTSDSNLAWVSRGEHIMPARVVRQPGMLAFLEALRRSGGHFARGGMVGVIPAYADGGAVGSGSNILDMIANSLNEIESAIPILAKEATLTGGIQKILSAIASLAQAIASLAEGTRQEIDVVRRESNTHMSAIEKALIGLGGGMSAIEKAIIGLGAGGLPRGPGLSALERQRRGLIGNALGGLIGGRGTGTSDSNLAWLSRGEYVMPARVVRQPGMLAFLEELRRSMGFALGGLVRGPMAIPAFAAGGLNTGMSHVTIQFPGLAPIGGLRASSAVVDELRHAAALAQVRSGGRKPSRYS